MCTTYTQKYDCDQIYGVQTRLYKAREHGEGAELVTPRKCPKYVNKRVRAGNDAKKQKLGDCWMCKVNASAQDDKHTNYTTLP